MTIDAPPDYVIEAARLAGIQSPCAKSKRGCATFNREKAEIWERTPPSSFLSSVHAEEARREHVVISTGFNGQPPPFMCSGTALCRRDCAQLCLHAEDRAIRAAGALDDVGDLELVHVKVVDGKVVPGKGPGCAQCSRLVVESGIRGIWLLEEWYDPDCPSARCLFCTGAACIQCIDTGPGRPRCEHASDERHKGLAVGTVALWRYYQAEHFHQQTIKNLELGDPR